jgi:hypothetical protein
MTSDVRRLPIRGPLSFYEYHGDSDELDHFQCDRSEHECRYSLRTTTARSAAAPCFLTPACSGARRALPIRPQVPVSY